VYLSGEMNSPTTTDLHRAVVRAYDALHRASGAVLDAHALTEPEFAILRALREQERLILSRLQKLAGVSSGGVTWLVDRLERRGLVQRVLCATDRRVRYAELTPLGATTTDAIARERDAAIAEAIGTPPPDAVLHWLDTLGH